MMRLVVIISTSCLVPEYFHSKIIEMIIIIRRIYMGPSPTLVNFDMFSLKL